jgi:hypothetical protein
MGTALRSAAETARDLLLYKVKAKQEQQTKMQEYKRELVLKQILAAQQQQEELAKEQRTFDRKKEYADYAEEIRRSRPGTVLQQANARQQLQEVPGVIEEVGTPSMKNRIGTLVGNLLESGVSNLGRGLNTPQLSQEQMNELIPQIQGAQRTFHGGSYPRNNLVAGSHSSAGLEPSQNELPDPDEYWENSVIQDDMGRTFRLVNGEWREE